MMGCLDLVYNRKPDSTNDVSTILSDDVIAAMKYIFGVEFNRTYTIEAAGQNCEWMNDTTQKLPSHAIENTTQSDDSKQNTIRGKPGTVPETEEVIKLVSPR